MSKLTTEQLDIQDAFEDGDLEPLFEEYILKNQPLPQNMALRLSYIIKERGLKPVLVQARRGPRKKQGVSLARKIEFLEYQKSLRSEMSALEAKEAAAKKFGVNSRKADEWNADARYFLKRLSKDGKNLANN